MQYISFIILLLQIITIITDEINEKIIGYNYAMKLDVGLIRQYNFVNIRILHS